MSLSTDTLRGYTDTIILRQLEAGDSYGYSLNKQIRDLSDGQLELKEATLYTAFRRLEAGGWIRSWWGNESSGARRRYYTLTEEGKRRLREDQAEWQETRAILDRLIGGGQDNE